MLKKPDPTLSPKRFKSSEVKNLLETIQNVSNRSVLNEFGIAGGPQTSTHDALMSWKPKKRGLGGLEVPGSDLEQDPSLPSLQKDTTTSSTGFGSGNQTTLKTPTITGPQSTALGGPSTGFRSKTSSAGGFSPKASDMTQVMSQIGSRAGKFGDVGGKPNPGMDYEAGSYYAVTEPMLGAAIAGGAESVAKAVEKLGMGSGDIAKIAGAAALGWGAQTAGELANAMQFNKSQDPTKFLTKPKSSVLPKLK